MKPKEKEAAEVLVW